MAGISASLPALCCVCGALQSRASSAMPFPSVQQELSHSPSRNVPQFGPVWLCLALTAQLLLPLHLVVQEGGLVEEVADFAALLVLLRGGEEPVLGLLGEELTDPRHGEDDLLHAPVQPHNLREAEPSDPALLGFPPPPHIQL